MALIRAMPRTTTSAADRTDLTTELFVALQPTAQAMYSVVDLVNPSDLPTIEILIWSVCHEHWLFKLQSMAWWHLPNVIPLGDTICIVITRTRMPTSTSSAANWCYSYLLFIQWKKTYADMMA